MSIGYEPRAIASSNARPAECPRGEDQEVRPPADVSPVHHRLVFRTVFVQETPSSGSWPSALTSHAA
jgi:hypothetical protein